MGGMAAMDFEGKFILLRTVFKVIFCIFKHKKEELEMPHV